MWSALKNVALLCYLTKSVSMDMFTLRLDDSNAGRDISQVFFTLILQELNIEFSIVDDASFTEKGTIVKAYKSIKPSECVDLKYSELGEFYVRLALIYTQLSYYGLYIHPNSIDYCVQRNNKSKFSVSLLIYSEKLSFSLHSKGRVYAHSEQTNSMQINFLNDYTQFLKQSHKALPFSSQFFSSTDPVDIIESLHFPKIITDEETLNKRFSAKTHDELYVLNEVYRHLKSMKTPLSFPIHTDPHLDNSVQFFNQYLNYNRKDYFEDEENNNEPEESPLPKKTREAIVKKQSESSLLMNDVLNGIDSFSTRSNTVITSTIMNRLYERKIALLSNKNIEYHDSMYSKAPSSLIKKTNYAKEKQVSPLLHNSTIKEMVQERLRFGIPRRIAPLYLTLPANKPVASHRDNPSSHMRSKSFSNFNVSSRSSSEAIVFPAKTILALCNQVIFKSHPFFQVLCLSQKESRHLTPLSDFYKMRLNPLYSLYEPGIISWFADFTSAHVHPMDKYPFSPFILKAILMHNAYITFLDIHPRDNNKFILRHDQLIVVRLVSVFLSYFAHVERLVLNKADLYLEYSSVVGSIFSLESCVAQNNYSHLKPARVTLLRRLFSPQQIEFILAVREMVFPSVSSSNPPVHRLAGESIYSSGVIENNSYSKGNWNKLISFINHYINLKSTYVAEIKAISDRKLHVIKLKTLDVPLVRINLDDTEMELHTLSDQQEDQDFFQQAPLVKYRRNNLIREKDATSSNGNELSSTPDKDYLSSHNKNEENDGQMRLQREAKGSLTPFLKETIKDINDLISPLTKAGIVSYEESKKLSHNAETDIQEYTAIALSYSFFSTFSSMEFKELTSSTTYVALLILVSLTKDKKSFNQKSDLFNGVFCDLLEDAKYDEQVISYSVTLRINIGRIGRQVCEKNKYQAEYMFVLNELPALWEALYEQYGEYTSVEFSDFVSSDFPALLKQFYFYVENNVYFDRDEYYNNFNKHNIMLRSLILELRFSLHVMSEGTLKE